MHVPEEAFLVRIRKLSSEALSALAFRWIIGRAISLAGPLRVNNALVIGHCHKVTIISVIHCFSKAL